jgi:hypothetical protein
MRRRGKILSTQKGTARSAMRRAVIRFVRLPLLRQCPARPLDAAAGLLGDVPPVNAQQDTIISKENNYGA